MHAHAFQPHWIARISLRLVPIQQFIRSIIQKLVLVFALHSLEKSAAQTCSSQRPLAHVNAYPTSAKQASTGTQLHALVTATLRASFARATNTSTKRNAHVCATPMQTQHAMKIIILILILAIANALKTRLIPHQLVLMLLSTGVKKLAIGNATPTSLVQLDNTSMTPSALAFAPQNSVMT